MLDGRLTGWSRIVAVGESLVIKIRLVISSGLIVVKLKTEIVYVEQRATREEEKES